MSFSFNYCSTLLKNKQLCYHFYIYIFNSCLTKLFSILLTIFNYLFLELLILIDEVTDPSLTVFVEGHQWYWSYQYPDFLNEDDGELELEFEIEFDYYLAPGVLDKFFT